jgi:5-methylcytosine-specific restriction endonuclease McrA
VTKACSKCGTEKSLESFSPNRLGRLGRHSVCRACQGVANARWREANRERKLETDAAYRAANHDRIKAGIKEWRERNRERQSATAAAWYAANRERKLAKNAEWRAANLQRFNEAGAAWRAANPDRLAAYTKKYRDLRASAPGSEYTTDALIAARVQTYGGLCFYCGDQATEVDHRIPLSRGGSHWPANIVPACRSCNARKGTGDVHTLIERLSKFDAKVAAGVEA